MLTEMEIKWADNMPPAQQKQRFDYAFTNNNDQKYLHKKFKKMASSVAHQPPSENEIRSREPDHTPCTSQFTPYKVPATTQVSLTLSNTREDGASSQVNEAKLQNNVQTKCKDTNDVIIPPATTERSNSDWNNTNYIEEKIFTMTEIMENDVSNVKDNTVNGGYSGRYICPYCKLSCAKPSVLQKHIRAHTNERPYPCVPCGFAFKTKSNLYKHCRSRTHALRLQGGENVIPCNEDDWSMGSESDTSLPAAPLSDAGVSLDAVSLRMDIANSDVSTPDLLLLNDRVTPPTTSAVPLSQTEVNRPKAIYKPKFHKASLYQDEEQISKKLLSPNPDFLNQHISKIISDNEAIVETIDSPLQKKYSKITNLQKQMALNENINNITLCDSLKHESQPLNLTKSTIEETIHRKRCYSESFANQEQHKIIQHPLNPEGSIIKDLLLKARAQASGLLPVTQETYDPTETLYICPLCQIPYRSTDNLKTHQLHYCKGNKNLNGLGTSQKESLKIYRPEHVYMRSNSVNVTLPESYTPNTLAKLATSTLKSPINVSQKPDNLVIIKPENDIAAPLPSPGPLLGNTRLVDTRIRSGNAIKLIENNFKTSKPLSSPKRRSETTLDRFSPLSLDNKGIQRVDMYSPQNKIRCMETNPTTLRSLEELSLAPMRQNSTSLQMFGGEVKIVDNAGGIKTFRIEADNRSPTLVPQSSPNNTQNKFEQTEKSSVVVRSGLHSGGTIVQNLPTPKDTERSPMPSTPLISMSMGSNISSPSFSVSSIPTPNMSHFQFPPLVSITAFNPLTLPASSPSLTPNGATTILHGGKLIPYVPGIPGPNTPSSYISTITAQGKYMPSSESRSFSPKASKEEIYPRLSMLSPKAKISKQDLNLPANRGLMKSPNTHTLGTGNVERSKVSLQDNKKNIELDFDNKSLPIPNVKIVTADNNSQVRINSVNGYSKRRDYLQRSPASKDSLLMEVPEERLKEIFDNSQVTSKSIKSGTPEKEMRNFNFENLISKSEIYNNVQSRKSVGEARLDISMQPLTVAIQTFERSETSYFKKNNDTCSKSTKDDGKTKFLRPSSLPLKPGTFIPKKHHGITPNANTMPLISPETPRPAKAYGQLYLNGHAYTYLGLKCSTKVYYCTLNRPQPTYVPNQHSLSMYSNWQICSEAAPHPLGLSAGRAMAQYDSRHRPQTYTVSSSRQELRLTHSSQWNDSDVRQTCTIQDTDKSLDGKQNSEGLSRKELAGGFESNEEYTYVRGRGRGRYVCGECGIRCKKPSMLKKHIRTHTDVRPYTCKHCAFSFKTKGNLTKHMKSKAHYKKCCELGISPSEGAEVREGTAEAQGSGDTDDDTDSDADDGNEGETESSDTDSWKSRLPEHEAAQSLLSLWGAPPSSTAPGLITSARPSTYPYTPSEHHDTDTDTQQLHQREPMDLSRTDFQHKNMTQVVTAPHEPSVLASLAHNTSKLPKQQNHWGSGEPMLQAYLTEKALRDSKIKESQYTASKLKKLEEARQSHIRMNDSIVASEHTTLPSSSESVMRVMEVEDSSITGVPASVEVIDEQNNEADNAGMETLADIAASSIRLSSSCIDTEVSKVSLVDVVTSTDNAKFVASEYLKMASGKGDNLFDRNTTSDGIDENSSVNVHHIDDHNIPKERRDSEVKKSHAEHTPVARNVVVGAGGVVPSSAGEYTPTSVFAPVYASGHLAEDGRSVCAVCNKSFLKPSQLRLHINIHYMERPFRCSACAVSFRTRGHLQKHERSGSHHNKVSMTSTFGTATSSNPRPFKCSDCNIAFRIHGHLAKHLRSKMHVMRLECLCKLPFGTFAEIERAGVSLTDIDTTDCANSLASLQLLAQKLHEKDPTKLGSWDPATMVPPLLPAGRESSDEDEPSPIPITKYSATDT